MSLMTFFMRFDGTDWVSVGTGRFSPHFSYDPTIVIDSTGAPYVTFEPTADDLRHRSRGSADGHSGVRAGRVDSVE